jgi:glutaredoxin 3
VKNSPPDLEEMLGHSKGQRKVPVILEEGKVTIGYGGT